MFTFERNMPEIKYSIYAIKKKNGKKRIITAPNSYLKECQSEIMRYLNTFPLSEHAHGFVENRSIATNASHHVNKKYVLNIDIKSFFPSVTRDMVESLFSKLDIPNKFVDVVLLNNVLPQGSPCSPVISNLICVDIDNCLSEYAKLNNLSYTRYADDITLSGDNISRDTIEYVYSVLNSFSFKPNKEKTVVYGRHKRQMVTGLVVNERVNIPRETRRRLRAMKHQYEELSEYEKEFLQGWNGIEQMIKSGDL